jgi:ribosomal RNA methyltransferase Nop2
MSSRAVAARGKASKPAPSAKTQGKQFSDHNKSWLKPVQAGAASAGKKRSLFEEEDDDDDEDDDDEEEEGSEEEGSEEEGEEEDDDDEGEDDEDEEEGDDDDDEDEEDEDEELEFERKARRTMAKLSADAAANEAELRDQIASESVLPTAEELAEEQQRPPDISTQRDRIKQVAEVLADFANRREPGRARHEYVNVLASDLAMVYGYSLELIELLLGLFSPAEALSFIEASETPRPVTVRTNTLKTRRRELAQALIGRNVNLDPIAKWSKEGLQIYESAVPIGATPEYLAGHYMVQSASSFLPVMALAPGPNMRCLEMAAAPGGKSSHMAALMGNTGTLVSNDASKERLRALQANLSRLGVRNAIVMNADGRDFPKLMGGFDRVLLDAPCTGLGVISKDPSVKAEKTYADVQRCQQLQRELLLAAVDSVNANSADGGFVVYSTCSISVEENEAVVDYVLNSRNVKVVETGLPFGVEGMTRHRSKRFHASLKHCRRFYPHTHNMDGFFVCKLRKFSNAIPSAPSSAAGANGADKKKQGANGAGASGGGGSGDDNKPSNKPKKKGAKDPNSAAASGPAPKIGAARPGGGEHGDGEKAKAKRLAGALREQKRLKREEKKKQKPRKKQRLLL